MSCSIVLFTKYHLPNNCSNTKIDCHVCKGHQNVQTNIFYISKTFLWDIDNLSIKHRIAQEHQTDMDKMCQCHQYKQEHNMSTRARTRTTITTLSHPSIRSTSNHQHEEEELSTSNHQHEYQNNIPAVYKNNGKSTTANMKKF